MEKTSSAGDLTDRLRRRLETERRQIEELTASELARLAENSRRVARNALSTIERDTEEATGRHARVAGQGVAPAPDRRPSLWLGFFGGSWATMRWLTRSIQDRIETAAGLGRDIEDARRTLAQLEVDTWGIRVPRDQGRAVRGGADGALADPPWRVDGRPALKLSNE